MKWLLLPLILSVFGIGALAQGDSTVIQIKLINGQTGEPMKVQNIGLEDRAGYREISVHPDALGTATLTISRDTTILTHNTHEYVDCADEHGGLIHNDYKVSDIVSTGIVEHIAQPNLCIRTSGSAKPGELILFVRPWRPGEDM
jgi:acetoacetate decarboxylase